MLKRNWFIIAIFLVPLFAWAYPDAGARHGVFLSLAGVAIIFFITGMGLHWEELIQAAANHKLNSYVLGGCFIAFPLAGWAYCRWIFPMTGIDPGFESGTLILSCVPITTASCVSFTLRVKGDAPAALFNALISNLIGVFFTPVLLTYLLSVEGEEIAIQPLPIIIKLFVVILLPLALGNLIGKRMPEEKRHHRFLSECVLIGILYLAFSRSFLEMPILPLRLISVLGSLHFLAIILPYFISLKLPFSQKERRTILFTIPQKTIAVGLPLAVAITNGNTAYNLFPMLVYTNMQWLTAAAISAYLSYQPENRIKRTRLGVHSQAIQKQSISAH